MTNEGQANVAVELESARTALQAARKELESARDRENKLLDTLKGQASALSETGGRGFDKRRYAEYLILLGIVALAGWQVYLMLQLKDLLT